MANFLFHLTNIAEDGFIAVSVRLTQLHAVGRLNNFFDIKVLPLTGAPPISKQVVPPFLVEQIKISLHRLNSFNKVNRRCAGGFCDFRYQIQRHAQYFLAAQRI